MNVGFSEQDIGGDLSSVEDEVYDSWMQYLQNTLGRSHDFARERALADVTRSRARFFVQQLIKSGWPIKEMSILDLGSGHGTLAVELALAGANVTAVEPCEPWRAASIRRAQSLGLSINHSSADGAALPFSDAAFDGCISLQVLEHVRSPKAVINEISRVLRPSGRFYITAENYLCFHEPHYGVPWLPLMPKWMGAAYLRCLGRNPKFLKEHITYSTWPALAHAAIACGLIDDGWHETLCLPKEQLKWKFRALHSSLGWLASDEFCREMLVLLQNRRKLFRRGFQLVGRKWAVANSSA